MKNSLTAKEIDLFTKLREKRIIQSLNMMDHSMSALIRGSSDIYPDPAHFVYELLQNADDAQATEAYFYLQEDTLIFKHNGTRQFTITEDGDLGETVKPSPYGDINAITAYNSSKDEKQNTIGKFGLGFKSVYIYTDRPEIYDDKFWFAIENRMVPIMLNSDHPYREPGETLFVLPFNDAVTSVNEIAYKLSNLSAPTLFLRHLNTVHFENNVYKNSHKLIKEEILHFESGNIKYEFVNLEDFGKSSKMLLFHRRVNAADARNLEVMVGYFFNKNGEIDTLTTRGIHCFFPTKETFGLCFISHAPFLLTNNRQNINESPINKKLIQEICRLAADALVIIRDYSKNDKQLITDNLYEILPYKYYKEQSAKYDWQQDFGNLTSKIHFLNAMKDLLKKEPLLYTISKGYVTSKKACFLETSKLRPILNVEEVRTLRKNQELDLLKIDEDADLREFLEEFLGIKPYKRESLAKDITPDFMESHGVEWAIKLYKYLKEDARRLWDKNSRYLNLSFRYAPIFLSQNGKWIAPFKMVGKEEQPNIYLPIGNAKGKYNLIHASLIDSIDKPILAFYSELGIDKPDIIDFIQKHIVPKYKQDEIEDDALIEDIYTILGILDDNENKQRRDDILALVRKHIKLVGTDNHLHDPDDLYVACPDLKIYFKNNNNVSFVDVDFYLDDKRYITKEDLLQFFITLGVNTSPRVLETTQSYTYSFNEKRLTKVDFAYSTGGYTIKDYVIEGFTNLIEGNLTKESSLYIWSVLARMEFKDNLIGYYDYFYRTSRRGRFESTLIDYLRHSKWIINADSQPCSVKDITQEDLLSLGYVRSSFLFELLDIKKSAKSLAELGATKEQQRQQELGEVAEKFGVLTPEELEEILKDRKELKKKRETNQSANNGHGQQPLQPAGQSGGVFGSLPSGKESSDLDDLFGDTELELSIHTSSGTHRDSSNQKNIEDLKRKLEEDGRKKLEREALRQETEELPKYTKEWFKKKLELEYRDTSSTDTSSGIKRSVSISFGKIYTDKDNNRIYELRNPSRDIPTWIEEIENLTVNFLFNNRDEMACTFEVANVRDFSLRLKVKASDADSLASIDWSQFTKASIDINNPTNLINNFRRAFNDLLLPNGFNLKDNLRQNISFVFGPPGTGKTTYLANKIVDEMNNSRRNIYRILVLTPTNKACDVLVRKIMEIDDNYTWLGRFVTTGDTEIEEKGVVCDRDSDLYTEDKCCIVTTMARLPYDGFTDGTGFHGLKDIDWNLIICDEASMLPIAQIVYAIYKFKNTPVLIAGDPMQIAPIDVTNNWDSENIYDMVNLKSFDNPKTEPIQFKIHNLETQYRSIPVIGGLFSDYAYSGRLKHHWQQSDQLSLNIRELPLKSINFIPFRVENYDSMFGAKKLANSPIHIYSALLCSQLGRYLAKKYVENNPDEEDLAIGIVCPYASQAQLIQKMLEQVDDIPEGANKTVGTIHSFQGDQCNIIIAMLNPPIGLRSVQAASKMHINNKNIINVAISRAKDYLCLLIPDKETCEGFDNLIEVKRLGAISSTKYREETGLFPTSMIERIIFGQTHFLEENTFVTSHQLANVYTTATSLYEVRVDENSVDIQIGDNNAL